MGVAEASAQAFNLLLRGRDILFECHNHALGNPKLGGGGGKLSREPFVVLAEALHVGVQLIALRDQIGAQGFGEVEVFFKLRNPGGLGLGGGVAFFEGCFAFFQLSLQFLDAGALGVVAVLQRLGFLGQRSDGGVVGNLLGGSIGSGIFS